VLGYTLLSSCVWNLEGLFLRSGWDGYQARYGVMLGWYWLWWVASEGAKGPKIVAVGLLPCFYYYACKEERGSEEVL